LGIDPFDHPFPDITMKIAQASTAQVILIAAKLFVSTLLMGEYLGSILGFIIVNLSLPAMGFMCINDGGRNLIGIFTVLMVLNAVVAIVNIGCHIRETSILLTMGYDPREKPRPSPLWEFIIVLPSALIYIYSAHYGLKLLSHRGVSSSIELKGIEIDQRKE
jgi:hypothetical protein